MLIRILLIEDDSDFRELLKFRLSHTHSSICFELHWEKTLSGALSYLEQSTVDLIIVDLGLPDSRGSATAFRLAAGGTTIPFIVLTGEDSDSAMWNVIRSGAEDHIVKGQLTTETLVVAILNAIARHFQRKLQPGLEQVSASESDRVGV